MAKFSKSLHHLFVSLLMTVFITSFTVTGCHAFWRSAYLPHPPKVASLESVQEADGIHLIWKPVAGCSGYRISYIKLDNSGSNSLWLDVDASQTTYLFKDVSAGDRYSFRISALSGGEEGPPSTPVNVLVKEKTAAKPSDLGK